jgi:hypothetical protein
MSIHQRIVPAGLSTSLDGSRGLSEDWLWFVVFVIFIGPTLVILLVSLGIAFNVPGVVHHQSKVVVIVDTSRDVVVVLSELF